MHKLSEKRPGRKRYFTPELEELITRMFLVEDHSAEELADKFRPLSRTGRLTPSGVRSIVKRTGLTKEFGGGAASPTP